MLSSTNLIENLFSRMRETARRVKRGRHDDPEMDRGGMLEAETYFPQSRRLRAIPKLVAALRAHDSRLDASTGKVAAGKAAA